MDNDHAYYHILGFAVKSYLCTVLIFWECIKGLWNKITRNRPTPWSWNAYYNLNISKLIYLYGCISRYAARLGNAEVIKVSVGRCPTPHWTAAYNIVDNDQRWDYKIFRWLSSNAPLLTTLTLLTPWKKSPCACAAGQWCSNSVTNCRSRCHDVTKPIQKKGRARISQEQFDSP